jgi:hypothetical protein
MQLRAKHAALSNGSLNPVLVNNDLFIAKKSFNSDDVYLLMNVNASTDYNIKLNTTILGSTTTLTDPISCTNYDSNGTSIDISLTKLSSIFLIPNNDKNDDVCIN